MVTWTPEQAAKWGLQVSGAGKKPLMHEDKAGLLHPSRPARPPSYNPQLVTAFLAEWGVPAPEYELKFHPTRKWRFDLAWPAHKVAMEVQGGLFSRKTGGHNRGAQILAEHEKYNAAAGMGWRMLYCTPENLMTRETADIIKAAICA